MAVVEHVVIDGIKMQQDGCDSVLPPSARWPDIIADNRILAEMVV